MKRVPRRLGWVFGLLLGGSAAGAAPEDDAQFFEQRIRPLLVEHCYSCHSPQAKKLKGGLRVDSRELLLKGGDTGPAFAAGKPEKSLIVEALSWSNPDLKMPPKTKLAPAQIADVSEWVRRGAPWPATGEVAGASVSAFDLPARKAAHWSWSPLSNPVPPAVRGKTWLRDPLDAFLLAKLEAKGLLPAAPASPRDLIRRLTFDLTGLPPSNAEVEDYVRDPSEAATAALVDRLLASPQFGETWGRHWLDLFRYAESRGHEFDYSIPNAWRYRDYVIRAFNADVPYAQLVQEHLAGDLLPEPRLHPVEKFNESVLGTGWWYLGEWIHSPVDPRADEMDRVTNQIEVFGKAFLGLTIACARCHDHKFDAISQKDFTALAGFLRSADYRLVRYDTIEEEKRTAAKLAALEPAKALEDWVAGARAAVGTLPRQFTSPDPAWAAHFEKAAKDPDDLFHVYALAKRGGDLTALRERQVARVKKAQAALEGFDVVADYRQPGAAWAQDGAAFHLDSGGPVWSLDPERPVHAVLPFPGLVYDPFWDVLKVAPGQEGDVGKRKWMDAGRRVRGPEFEITRPRVFSLVTGSAWAFASVDSHRMVEGPLHGATIAESKPGGRRWISHDLRAYVAGGKPVHHAHVEFTPRSSDFAVHLIVQGDREPADPFDVPHDVHNGPDDPVAIGRSIASRLRAPWAPRLLDWVLRHPELMGEAPEAARDFVRARRALADAMRKESRLAVGIVEGMPSDERLLIRGFSGTPKDVVPRRFLEALVGKFPDDLHDFDGPRLRLAKQVTEGAAPQFPRVIVNRVWHHLFGRGIVPTVDDFGKMGLPPTHPELLDHLAARFLEDGGSIKKSIRRIVLSAAYRMSTTPSAGALEVDPGNTLLHHHLPRRLTSEAVRDAMLAVSGRLDRTLYGPPVAVHLDGFQDGRGKPGSGPLDGAGRRSVYLGVRRNFLSTMQLAFDFPQPFSAMGRRSVSNVPAQALVLRNHPFVHGQAAYWAARLAKEGLPPAERIDAMFRTAYGRPADPAELEAAAKYLADTKDSWEGLAHALFQAKEFIFLR